MGEDLKRAINEFLWQHAPSRMTLGHAEQVAAEILQILECAEGAVAQAYPKAAPVDYEAWPDKGLTFGRPAT